MLHSRIWRKYNESFFSRGSSGAGSLAAGTGHWAVARPGATRGGQTGGDRRAGRDWTLSGHWPGSDPAGSDTQWRNVWTGLGPGQGLPMYWNLLDQSTSVHCVQHTGQHSVSSEEHWPVRDTRGHTLPRETQRRSPGPVPKLCPVSMETETQDNG